MFGISPGSNSPLFAEAFSVGSNKLINTRAIPPLSKVLGSHSFSKIQFAPVPLMHSKKHSHFASASALRGTSTSTAREEEVTKGPYDLIVIGSGNGACALLSQCLEHASKDLKVLVLEQGEPYFSTSDITHQNGWSKTYSTGSIF
jgi:hypothetical protein